MTSPSYYFSPRNRIFSPNAAAYYYNVVKERLFWIISEFVNRQGLQARDIKCSFVPSRCFQGKEKIHDTAALISPVGAGASLF